MRSITLALLLLSASGVRAEAPTHVEIESALTKMLVGEVGLKADLDHRAILFAIHRLDEHERRSSNVIETMHLHIQWWKHGAPPNRPWIAGINTTCNKPEGFPLNLDWDNHQWLCFRVVERVRAYYAHRLINPCKGRANNWRARGKPSRRAKRLYYQVGCGRSSLHNWFDTRRMPNGKRR